MKLRGEYGNQIQKRQWNRSRNGDENEGTLYWELSSSLSSGISPFLVVEKYFESFLLIFPSSLCYQYYSSSASDFWFPISDSEPTKRHHYACLDRRGRTHGTAS